MDSGLLVIKGPVCKCVFHMQTNPSRAHTPTTSIFALPHPPALITQVWMPDQSPLELFKLANLNFAQLPHLFLPSETTTKALALGSPTYSAS